MGTPKNAKVGSLDYILAIDAETTVLLFGADDPSEGHQAVSWGIIVADAKTLQPVEKLYVEIKWNELSKQKKKEDPTFGCAAAKIHGLTFNHLEQNGVDEEEAALLIATLILKYWGPTVTVKTLGHNVHSFDVPFLRAMFRRQGIDVRFGGRHYDTNSAGFIALETYNSDDLFTTIGYDTRQGHNALQDAEMALGSARAIRLIVTTALLEVKDAK